MGATRDSWALRKLQTVRWEGPWSSWFLLFNPLKSQGLSTHTAQLSPFQMDAGCREEAERGGRGQDQGPAQRPQQGWHQLMGCTEEEMGRVLSMSIPLIPQGNDLKRPAGPDLSPQCPCRPPGPDCVEGTGTCLTSPESLPAPPASLKTGETSGTQR